MKYLSEEQVGNRIEHRSTTENRGRKDLPMELRALIGISAKFDGPTKAAKAFGVTPVSSAHWRDGSIDGGKTVNEELQSKVEGVIEGIRDKALERTMAALHLLDDEKLGGAKARDLASIAKDTATVFEKTQPKVSGPTNNVQVVVYTPPVRDEKRYDVIEIEGEIVN